VLAGTALTVAMFFAVVAPAAAYDWLQFNGDPAHSGNNTAETLLTAANVSQLTQKYQITLPSTVDGVPVFLQGVSTPGGVKDLLFVTTMAGHVFALDASSGATVWTHQYGAGSCIDSNGGTCYTTSSPAIDPNRLYVYSYGLDGNVHKYQVGDGTEILTGGWPQVTTLKGDTEKGSSALAIATSGATTYLYVTHGGYPGDAGDYQGHVTAINLATGTQKVFNAMCSDQTVHLTKTTPDCAAGRQTAVWARPGVVYDSGTDRIFFGTGNSSNGGYDGVKYWSESVLAIHPDGTGASSKPVDSYTPANFSSLDGSDADLGSTAPAILPVPANSNVQHLAAQGGKDSQIRLINLGNMSGQGGPGHTSGEVQAAFALPQGGVVLSQPAVWVNPADSSTWVFVGTGGGLAGFKLSVDGAGNPTIATQWHTGTGGTSPVVANNVLFYAGGGVVRAVNPATGATLWTSSSVGSTHWQSPIVANGAVYVTGGSNHLTAFALPSVAPGITSAGSASFQIGVPGTFTVTATGVPAPTLSESGSLPSGVAFTASSGLLAGTPAAGSAGTYPLQFTASNGISPNAMQSFTLTVGETATSLIFNDTTCASFTLTGPVSAQVMNCIPGGGGATPVCTPTASPPSPVNVKQATTISANCNNQPTANSYAWTGSGCAGGTGASCTVSRAKPSTVTFTVRASNASGQGSPASISVTWK
jgi:Putative Ig domain/PQQ-like domain